MKVLQTMLVAMMVTLSLTACKKEQESAPPPTIEGKWEGKYADGNDDPHIYYALQVKPGGLLDRIDAEGHVQGTGTWSLSANVFIGTYQKPDGATFSIATTYDANAGTMTGNWGFGYNTSDGGKIALSKKQ